MIRLNKFFTAKGAAGPVSGDATPSASVAGDPDFAMRLRRALDRGGDVEAPDDEPVPDSEHSVAEETVTDLRPATPIVARPVIPPQQRLANVVLQTPSPRTVEPTAPPVIPKPAAPMDLSQIATGPAEGTGGRRSGRVRTRLLGYDPMQLLTADPIEAARAVPSAERGLFPVGWIVVTRGPGRGSFFALFNGVSQIGRGEDQAIKLDFGDTSISRSNHAAIAYDDESNGFFLGHGGKANIVRLNDRPVISTETLQDQDLIRIGETTLRFVALCTGAFRWTDDSDGTGAID